MEIITELVKKYNLLLNQSFNSMKPIDQCNWKNDLKIPWIYDDAEMEIYHDK